MSSVMATVTRTVLGSSKDSGGDGILCHHGRKMVKFLCSKHLLNVMILMIQ